MITYGDEDGDVDDSGNIYDNIDDTDHEEVCDDADDDIESL